MALAILEKNKIKKANSPPSEFQAGSSWQLNRFFHNLLDEEKEKILNYELDIYICEGTEEEKLDWFRVINIAGVTLTNQELLNATYTGPWLQMQKRIFQKEIVLLAKWLMDISRVIQLDKINWKKY